MACNEESAFSLLMNTQIINCGLAKNCEGLVDLFENNLIRFGTKLHRRAVCIVMKTNCVPLVADWFLFCCERYFKKSFSGDT